MADFEIVGRFLCMNIGVTKDGTPQTPEAIRKALQGFNTVNLLRTLGAMAAQPQLRETSEFPTPDSLTYIARAAIEAGSDVSKTLASQKDVRRVARMYHNLVETHEADDYEAIRILLRMGYAQLTHQAKPGLLIARSWYLYLDLWGRVDRAATIQVEDEIEKLIGAPYHKALGLGLAYWGNSSKGYTQPYNEDAQEKLRPKYRSSPDEARKIFDWMSCTYADIRRQASDTTSKYGLSPFLRTPLVKPDVVPDGASADVRVVPFPVFVLEKMTSGIFYSLADAYNLGGDDNEFRTLFGHVFEAYVGELLKAGSGTALVLPEFEYVRSGEKVKSPDWMVIQDDTLVVIEAKASALTLATKMSGSIRQTKSDLAGNLGKAVGQLRTFKEDLVQGRTGNQALKGIERFQLLAVTHDRIPWANFIFRQLIADGADDVQFAGIEELELLQTYCWGQSPFRVLQAKTSGTHTSRQDLGSYVAEYHGPARPRHPMLGRICDDFLRDIGVDVPEGP